MGTVPGGLYPHSEVGSGGLGWAGEKLVLTELEGRFRDTCFCCAGWNDVASERSLSPPCEGSEFRVLAFRGGDEVGIISSYLTSS